MKLLTGLFAGLLFSASCKKDVSNQSDKPATPTPFQGRGGIYYLGSADIPLNNNVFTNSSLAGVVVRFKWESLETAPGIFNWTFIDNELAKARASNKKVSLQPLGYPAWITTSLGARTYRYIDKNQFHTTYLDTLSDVITWDEIYLTRVKNLIDKLAEKYAADTSIAYLNLVAGQISRGLPDSVITPAGPKPFWTEFPYNADTVVLKMKSVLDLYMQSFPKTPLWNSVDYVPFEQHASGRPINYLTSQYVSYGVSKYPDRFGCWREDISGCNPQLSISGSSHWYVMSQHADRTGAQMLWSVQDGPSRMNKCSILPNTKQVVLDSSVNNGLRLGMRYFEIYGADIQDPSLSANIQAYHNLLKASYRL